MSLSANSINSVISGFVSIEWHFSCLWIIFPFFVIPGNFCSDARYEFYVVGCWILLNSFKRIEALLWQAGKLFGIFLTQVRLAFKLS